VAVNNHKKTLHQKKKTQQGFTPPNPVPNDVWVTIFLAQQPCDILQKGEIT
jgi:hypothetical protein